MSSGLVFLLSFVPRLIYLLTQGRGNNPALSYYWGLSESLLRYQTLGFSGQRSTAFEPLYPLFLAFSRWLTRDNFLLVMTLQITIASIGGVYFYKLCLELSKNHLTPRIGVLLYSFYPYLVRQSVAVIEISLLTTLLIWTAYRYVKATDAKNSLLCGIVFGLTLLLRTAAFPLWFLGVAALFLRRRFLSAFILAASSFLLLLPFLLRNYMLDGSWILSRSGLQFLVGNCKYTDKIIPFYSTDLLNNGYAFGLLEKEGPKLPGASQKEISQFFTQKGIEFTKENPGRTLKTKFLNLVYLFYPRIVPFHPFHSRTRLVFTGEEGIRVENPASRGRVAEWAYSISYGFIFLTALGGLRLRKKNVGEDSILHFTTLSFILVCSFYRPDTRLRAPMDFVLMFYSACTLSLWAQKLRWIGSGRH